MACCLIDVSSGRSLAGHRQTGCSDSHVVWLPVLPCFFLKVAPPPPTTIIALQSFAATALPSLFLDSSAAVQMCRGSRKSKCTSNVELNSLISITCLRGDGGGGGTYYAQTIWKNVQISSDRFCPYKTTQLQNNLHD